MPATATPATTTVPHAQQVALSLKKVIESVYTDGITAMLKAAKAADGTVTGRFADGPQVYDFTVDPKNQLTYNEAEAGGGRSDSYLIGYTLDSGMALQGHRLDFVAPKAPGTGGADKCVKGKRCGQGCIAEGLKCQQNLSPEASQIMNSVRSSMPQAGSAQPTAQVASAKPQQTQQPQPQPQQQQAQQQQAKQPQPQPSPAQSAKPQKVTDPKLISPEKNPVLNRKLAAFGLTGAAATAAVGGAAFTVVRDLKRSEVDFESIRTPPGGIPDEETMKVYDAFKPGDLIRKNFKGADGGGRAHYSVYVGRDPDTGDHQMVEVTGKQSDQGLDVGIYKSSLTEKTNDKNTQYEKFLHPGLSELPQ